LCLPFLNFTRFDFKFTPHLHPKFNQKSVK